MNTTIALNEIRKIGAWTPVDVDALAVAHAAIDAAMQCDGADAMKDAILGALAQGRVKVMDKNHALQQAWTAAVTLMGLRKFAGDEAKTQDYRAGYFFSVDAQGSECDPMFDVDVQAWQAGRDDNPDYAAHQRAKAIADAELKEKFGASAGTRKGYSYWLNRYFLAKNSAGLTA